MIDFEEYLNKQTLAFKERVKKMMNKLHKLTMKGYKTKIRLKRLRYKYFMKRKEY